MQASEGDGSFVEQPEHKYTPWICFQKVTKQPGPMVVGLSGNGVLRLLAGSLGFCLFWVSGFTLDPNSSPLVETEAALIVCKDKGVYYKGKKRSNDSQTNSVPWRSSLMVRGTDQLDHRGRWSRLILKTVAELLSCVSLCVEMCV